MSDRVEKVPDALFPVLRAMLIYNFLTASFLAYPGIAGQPGDILLRPAIVIHAVLTLVFVRSWFGAQPFVR